jgi:hypothetical protein
MARSSATTPAPATKPIFSNSYTWVHDWYSPEDSELVKLIKLNNKVKGWHRKLTESPDIELANSKCVLNLQNMKYYEEVPIVDHSKEKQIENEAKANENDNEINSLAQTESNDDLSKALSLGGGDEIDNAQTGIV